MSELDGLPIFQTPPFARRTDPETSHQAAASMKEGAEVQRRRILGTLREHGPQTADSLDELIDWRPTTAGRRLKELLDGGMVERTGLTAVTRSGRAADVWKLKAILAPEGVK